MSYDPVVKEHQEWLGFLQPVGLVVSPTALKNAQACIARNVITEQEILLRHTHEVIDENRNVKRRLSRFTEFAKEFWHWEESDLATPPENISTVLQEYGEILSPEFAVPGVKGETAWQLLIQELPAAVTMDQGGQNADERSWQASPQARFERLLRDNGIPIGLLVNPDAIRLVYAPRGETAGHITFPIQAMCETAGRPIVAALHLLLDDQRLFALPKEQRLPAILQASRKYQNEVSIKLADQVLRALNELCRGFNEANRASDGELLAQTLKEAPEDVYGGFLTTLMRLVFLLYAEDRNLMASGETYQRCYSMVGLHEKLREDDAAYHDVMDQRFGAWAQFLTLSRVVHDGGGHGNWKIPARRGRLFDPDCYPFLEGRSYKHKRSGKEKLSPPKVSDGVLFRVLEDLLYLDGERISYRALDVEQIGSVYESMMGFDVRRAAGTSIGFRPDHIVVNLDQLLELPRGERRKSIKESLGWELTERASGVLRDSDSKEALLGALNSRISPLYSDRNRGSLLIANGDIYLQPTDERRRSGSHYTPRSLTEPIVAVTLGPILQQLGENPRPEQILDLKVCDPAMGSGAFLVETCRYLADLLVKAWASHKETPEIPTDQDPLLHARRVIAQRCLYGVDKNHFAVDLAKLSLWLATFAKDHPFTFLDHSFRHGDSLVGLNIDQIVNALGDGSTLFRPVAQARVAEAIKARQSIMDAVETEPYDLLESRYQLGMQSVGTLRDLGDAVLAAFFLETKPKDRDRRRNELANAFETARFDVVAKAIQSLRHGSRGLVPFHWQSEFPEVFEKGGFNAIVGNPPFLGGGKISTSYGRPYLDFLLETNPGAHGNGDIVAHFFRKAFGILRPNGCFGLIATNTISQGDTRTTGLLWLRRQGATIFAARRRVQWPGDATVIVSVVHISRSDPSQTPKLDGRDVERITSYLFHRGGDEDPARINVNPQLSFAGSKPNGRAFLLSREEAAGYLKESRNTEVVLPFLSGEVNDDPKQQPERYAVCFRDWPEGKANKWPELMTYLSNTVRQERNLKDPNSQMSRYWWQFERYRSDLYKAIGSSRRTLVSMRHQPHWTITFVPAGPIFGDDLNAFVFDCAAAFSILQSRVHEIWARFFGSTLEDRLRYTPTDCFETFPFPADWKSNEELERIGEEYYQFRSDLMIRNNEGLTATYNRFHSKFEDNPEIQHLRDLHASIDRVVLDAYGWTDLQPAHDFILDYVEPEEEQEAGKPRKRKEPWRFRWPDEFRDEVLARLLELNRQRAEEERQAAPLTESQSAKTAKPKKSTKKKDEQTLAMFTEETTQ